MQWVGVVPESGEVFTHHHQGRTASGGSLAPEPPRAHWSGPELWGMRHEGRTVAWWSEGSVINMTLPSRLIDRPWHSPCLREQTRHVVRSRWVWWRTWVLIIIFLTKQTRHVNRSIWVWWRTWVLCRPCKWVLDVVIIFLLPSNYHENRKVWHEND